MVLTPGTTSRPSVRATYVAEVGALALELGDRDSGLLALLQIAMAACEMSIRAASQG